MLQINNVSKHFFDVTALSNVSITIPDGSVMGILGPNGAGKTTLFKIVAGLLNPDAGSLGAQQRIWPTIGYKPDRLLLPNHLRINQYLTAMAGVVNIPRKWTRSVVQESLQQVNLLEQARQHIGSCSKGMRQRIALAQALIGDPDLLLLDEPWNGLDPHGQQEMSSIIKSLYESGRTVVISTHRLHELTHVCTDLVILNRGQTFYQNSMQAALAEKPYVVIETTEDLTPVKTLLLELNPNIQISGRQIVLRGQAIPLRRRLMAILIGSGFDINHTVEKERTIFDLYSEAVK